MTYDVIVIGGGASGIVSSVVLARKGFRVAILEKNDRVGKKILATGNGKCNIMPAKLDICAYNSSAVTQTFNKCTYENVREFWQSIGVVTREVEGRCYPYSMQASSVLNALRKELERLKVDIFCGQEVSSISKNEFFIINKSAFKAKNIVLCTGSNATFGSDSLHLVASLGHKTNTFVPSLVPLLTDTTHLRGLKGVRAECGVSLIISGKTIVSKIEEVIFKDNGVSGSAIFEISAYLARARKSGAKLLLNFMPDKSQEEVIKILQSLYSSGHMLETLFHKEICNNLLKRLGCPFGKNIDKLAQLIGAYEIEIKGLGSATLAQVMMGGVSLQEIDMTTMASNKIAGLYVAGEVVYIAGVCGGYNLLWAVASVIAVGESIC